MKKSVIEVHNVKSFLNNYTNRDKAPNIIKENLEEFFVVKVEVLFQTMKLPIPPTRSTINSIIFLTEGSANMSIGNESYTIHKDECLIVPSGQVFSFENADVNVGYQCSFRSDFLIGSYTKSEEFDFLRVWGNHSVYLGEEISGYVKNIFERMLAEYVKTGIENIKLFQAYLMALLTELNKAHKPVTATAQSSAVLLSNRFRELLSEHLKTMHQVSEYASSLNITPNHLNKVVKVATGKSPTKWIHEAIVLEAKVLLYHTDLLVNQIAYELGLEDPSYFSRLFKKVEGRTPLEYRQMIEKS